MTKNEIVARWMGIRVRVWHTNVLYHCDEDGMCDFRYAKVYSPSRDYNNLMPAWVKFRDLKLTGDLHRFQHTSTCWKIADRIAYGTITEAFDELVKGIEWYESLKK